RASWAARPVRARPPTRHTVSRLKASAHRRPRPRADTLGREPRPPADARVRQPTPRSEHPQPSSRLPAPVARCQTRVVPYFSPARLLAMVATLSLVHALACPVRAQEATLNSFWSRANRAPSDPPDALGACGPRGILSVNNDRIAYLDKQGLAYPGWEDLALA